MTTEPPVSTEGLSTEAGCGCWRCIEGRGQWISFMVLCPSCGNKRCPHAADHEFACTGSNEPGQAGSAYEHGSGAATIRRLNTLPTPIPKGGESDG